MLLLMVSQSICLDAEPTLGLWPDIISRVKVCRKISFSSLRSADRSGLSFVSQYVANCLYEHYVCIFHVFTQSSNVQILYTRLHL
jgi:hypothetical protein